MRQGKLNKTVPFLDLGVQYNQLKTEIDEAIAQVFAKSSFVLGPEVEKFEGEFARYCGANCCVALNSGTAALHLALLAMGVGPQDEVITAANSFIATAEAIAFCGATPKLVDARPDTANIDVSKIEEAITERTKVIIPVHLYGQPAEMAAIKKLADKHGLRVLEDACQAHGATINGTRVGTFGEAAAFSFYPGKNIGAAGDGGAVVTNDERLAQHIRLLRNHGSEQKYHHLVLGHNFRLDSIQSAILSVKLRHLDSWNQKRREIASGYTKELEDLPGIETMTVIDGVTSVFHLYVIRCADRAHVESVLKEHGINYGIHYPVPIHLQPAFASLGHSPGDFPNAEALSDSVLSLPIYAELSVQQQNQVLDAVTEAARPGH